MQELIIFLFRHISLSEQTQFICNTWDVLIDSGWLKHVTDVEQNMNRFHSKKFPRFELKERQICGNTSFWHQSFQSIMLLK